MQLSNSRKMALLVFGILALLVVGVSIALLTGLLGSSPNTRITEVDPGPLTGGAPSPTVATSDCVLPVQYFAPQKGSPCSGCTVQVGDKFTLDLMVHALSANITAQQSYMLFSSDLLQNVDTASASCQPTDTVQADTVTYDTVLQNAVCNGPEKCVNDKFRLEPGSIAYASGALASCPTGCKGDARVAQVSFCARAMGTATIKWEFQEPARNTMLVGFDDKQYSPKECYVEYKVNISSK